MKAVPDTRRLSLIPKFIPYLLILAFVSFPRESWTREINSEVGEIRNENTRFAGDDSSIVIHPVNPGGQSNDDKTEVREKKTILSELPDKIKEIANTRTQGEVVDSNQSEGIADNVNSGENNDEGIRRFDVEINTEEEQPLNDSQAVESVDSSDKVIIESDSEFAKSARDDSTLRTKDDSIDSPQNKTNDQILNSEKLSEDMLALKKDIEERNPFLKKFLLNKKENEEENEEEEPNIRKLRSDADKRSDMIQRIKEKATLLQEQIQNATFLQKLKDQTTEVLPEVPSFTEDQLLEGLKLVISQKKISDFNESYSSLNISELSPLQQEILKCAEELMVQRQRQSFMNNMYQCIRGLSVLNCMRIFVYPVLIENIPQSLADNFPIEINVADIIKGSRNKVKITRREDMQSNELNTPEWQIYTILKTMLQNYPTKDRFEMFVDNKNETLASLLSPNQILILQMGEHLLPETVRQEYANQMFSCIRRFEYYSCIKYFAWPMIKHYLPMLPEFPSYYWTPPIIAEYPELIPYPAYQMGQLPEIIDADGTRTRAPKPEIVILGILREALREQQNLLPTHPSYVDFNRLSSRINREQLESIHTAEQLLPASVRSDYAQKTLSCINQHNYLHCIKHSTWPTVRRYTNLPDLSGYIPSFSLSNIGSWFNKPHIFGGGGGAAGGSGAGGGAGGADGGTGGAGSGAGAAGGSGGVAGGGSGSGAGSGGSSDPSGGIAGQFPFYPFPGIPGITFPGGSQQGGSQGGLQQGGSQQGGFGGAGSGFHQFIPPYPFIPFVPYPWFPPQMGMGSQGIGGGSQGLGGGSQGIGGGSQGIGGGSQGGGSQAGGAGGGAGGAGGIIGSGSGLGGQWGQWSNGSDSNQAGSGAAGSGMGQGTGAGSASGSDSGSGGAGGSGGAVDPGLPSYPSLPCKAHLKTDDIYDNVLTDWEDKIIEILTEARVNENISTTSSLFEKSKIPLSLTLRQLTILRLSEDLLPLDMTIRQDITTKMLECLEEKNLFANCLRIIIFPGIKEYVPSFPKLPAVEIARGSARADDDSIVKESPENHLTSSNENLAIKKINEPVISVTGTRFVPIFTEHPESVIYNIIRSIRLSNSHFNEKIANERERHSEISKILSERQENILLSASELIPNKSREEFINKTLLCAEENPFLHCARNVIWPYVNIHVPELPSFPNFENVHEKKSHLSENAPSSLDPAVLETNVEANQHGEHHITITDTRFVPVLSEQPETVVLKILKSIQLSVPNLSIRTPSESFIDKNLQNNLLSSEQVDILKTAETLLPEAVQEVFATKMFDCVGQSVPFLDCTRDIAFPAISQFHPTLPSFPHFGSSLKADRGISNSDKILQTEIENALRHTSTGQTEWLMQSSKVNVDNARSAYPILTEQQVNIIKLSESLLPEAARITYRARMLDCIQTESFLSCTQRNWPLLKQFAPSLPDFSSTNDLYSNPTVVPLSSLRRIPHLPQLSPVSPVSEIVIHNGLSGLPAVVDRRTLLTYDPNRMYRQVHPVNGAAPTLVQRNQEIPPYAGQPTSNFINLLSTEKIIEEPLSNSSDKNTKHNESRRNRRSIVNGAPLLIINNDEASVYRQLEKTSPVLNITESELLRVLVYAVKIRDNVSELKTDENAKYLIDEIDPNIRNNLTADQYEILKIVPQLNPVAGKAGFMSRLVQCIQSLSFIRCAGIFVWPMISSNLPSLPSLPSLPVSLPIPSVGSFFGRLNIENNEAPNVYSLSASDVANQLIERKNSTEELLLKWYESLLNEKFETNLGLITIRGYGNQELGITFSDARNGRSTKFKRRNIPRLLTIISDIVKDLFAETNPDKITAEAINKVRNIRNILQKSDRQSLLNAKSLKDVEDLTIDDRDFKAFLNKFRFNLTNYNENINHMVKYSDVKEAYKAFDVLFGTGLTHKLVSKLKSLKTKEEPKIVSLQIQEENIKDDLKVIKLNDQESYGIEADGNKQMDGRRIKKRRLTGAELTVRLPRVNEKLTNKKETESLIEIGKKMQTTAMQALPGVGLLLSLFLQMLLAHARAAASVATLMSNMAMGTAMFGMIRQSMFGSSTHPKIKYVYDNVDTGPGITWSRHRK